MTTELPVVPTAELDLDVRGLRVYIACDGEDLVLVLHEDSPYDERVVTIEPGLGRNVVKAAEGAENLGRTALLWAAMLRASTTTAKPVQLP